MVLGALLLAFAVGGSGPGQGGESPPDWVPGVVTLPSAGVRSAVTLGTVTRPTLFRLVEADRVLVAVFPDLDGQGRALNRLAALAEKAGAPRDRVLGSAELAGVITASGQTAATFYLGHDYRGSVVARFFALAQAQEVALTSDERALRDRLVEAGMVTTGSGPPGLAEAETALVAVSTDPRLSRAARRAILRHELSHAEYFTNSRYRAYVQDFWQALGGDRQRLFRQELGRLGYDAADTDLMANEMQAFLWEPNAAAFIDLALHRSHTTLDRLRAAFLEGLDRAPQPITAFFAEADHRRPIDYGLPSVHGPEKCSGDCP